MSKENEIIEFYRYYPVDHWIYKVNMLNNLIENYDLHKDIICEGLIEVIDKDCINMLKAEVHFILFQMIETLFELIFALEKRDDKKLWLYLSITQSTSRKRYKRIEKIGKGEINFINKLIKLPNGREIPLIYYLFYFGIKRIPIPEDKENFKKIKEILIVLAKDFTDRLEYNAYKHSLRFFQTPLEIELGELKEKERIPVLKFNSENNFTFLANNKGEIKKVSKAFDYRVDIEKIKLCHNLISNCINSRKTHFFDPGGKVKLAYFDKMNFDFLKKSENNLVRFESTIGWIKKKNTGNG